MHKLKKISVIVSVLIAGIIIGNIGSAFGYIPLGDDQPAATDPIPVSYWNENLVGLVGHDGYLVSANGGFAAGFAPTAAFLQGELAKEVERAKAVDPCLVLLPAVPEPTVQTVAGGIKVPATVDGDPKSPINWSNFVVLNDAENSHNGNQAVVISNENARWTYLISLIDQINHYRGVAGSSCSAVAPATGGDGNWGYNDIYVVPGHEGGHPPDVVLPYTDSVPYDISSDATGGSPPTKPDAETAFPGIE